MKIFVFLLLSLSYLYPERKEIELFMDWNCDAKGQDAFPLMEGTESVPLLTQIRRKLLEKDWDIRSWEREKYRSWLLKLSQVHTWTDFLHWLGFSLPRSSPITDPVKYWVFWSLGPKLKEYNFARGPKKNMVLFMWEPVVVQPESHDPKMHACFDKIFTWDDDLVDNVKYFKFHYPVWGPRIENIPAFEEKKFCTLINGRLCSKHPKQLYGEREKMIRFFEDKDGEFDLYGKFWEKRNYKNYRGAIGDKLSVLKNYKFCICYENTKDVRGYVTEKIFDCFKAGVIPVYLGASNVTDYIPKNCFIDRRDFKDDQAVYDFLKSMNKETYLEYQESADQFLRSDKAKVFSEDHFAETFLQII